MIRVGFAKDIHRLINNRKLILAGINVPFDKGEDAHSDGDVVFHALSEALLGSLALGDLGEHFPNNDDKYKNIDSKIILDKCYSMVLNKGFHINNIDISVELENPKIKHLLKNMKENISQLLKIDISLISIKANTNEKMDAVGKGEAVIAYALVTVSND